MKLTGLKAAVVSCSLFLGGCSSLGMHNESAVSAERQSFVVSAAYNAVDTLLATQQISPIISPNGSKGVLVATVADINNLEKSSAFGRLITEQMSTRLAQLGVPVTEVKLRGNLYVNNSGEFLLSRELKEMSSVQNADMVLVGTYANAGNAVYVTIKLVRASD